jgi:hypothetical protein
MLKVDLSHTENKTGRSENILEAVIFEVLRAAHPSTKQYSCCRLCIKCAVWASTKGAGVIPNFVRGTPL